MIQLQVMAIGKGHVQHDYDPNNKKDIEDMLKIIVEKLKAGFTVYGGQKGKDFTKIFDADRAKKKMPTDDEIKQELLGNDSLMLKEKVEKILLVPPVSGG